MKEIEVKILEVNRRFVEKSLFELGAKKIFDAEVLTLFFDFEDGRIINQKDVLRLRKNQEEIEITYKKVHTTQNAKTAEEFSVQVSSMEIMRKILEKLGLNVIDKMQKHRISYALNDARFDFDCYSGDYGYISKKH